MNNRNFLIILFLVSGITSVFGQNGLGFKVGGNYSMISGEFEYYKATYKPGYQVGITYRHLFANVLYVRPEILLAEKGAKIDYTITSYDVSYKLYGHQRVNYLEIPINFDFKLGTRDNFPFATVGVYWATAIGGRLTLENDFTDQVEPEDSRVIKYSMPMHYKDVVSEADQDQYDSSFEQEYGFLKKNDVGIKIGFGYQHKMMRVEAVYCTGLKNINPHEEGVTGYEITKRNKSFEISFSIFLE